MQQVDETANTSATVVVNPEQLMRDPVSSIYKEHEMIKAILFATNQLHELNNELRKISIK